MISVILVQHNRGDLTSACLESLFRCVPAGHEIIVVDNGSTDGSREMVTGRFGTVPFINLGRNRGFGAANNAGAAAARGDLLLFLNNDTYVTRDPLAPLEAYMRAHPECGVAGVSLLNPDGSRQLSSGRWPSILTELARKRGWDAREGEGQVRVEWVTGAALCIRPDLFRRLGGFDEGFFMYFEDVDLCRRVAATGAERHMINSIEVVHLGGASQSAGLRPAMEVTYRRSQLRYYAKHATPCQQRLLHMYLRAKGMRGSLFGSGAQRAVSREILRLPQEIRDAHRDRRP